MPKAEIIDETQNRYTILTVRLFLGWTVWCGSAVRGEERVSTLRRARCAGAVGGFGDGCTLFVRWVMLRAFVAKPVALHGANEAHALRMQGYVATVAKQYFTRGIIAAALFAWAVVAGHHSRFCAPLA